MPRVAPLLVILAALGGAYAFGLQRVVSFAWLSSHAVLLHALVTAHPAMSMLAFMLAYMAVALVAMPGGSVLSVTSGLLFGIPAGAACSVIGATTGAALLFLATRSALGGWLVRRTAPWLDRLRPGLERDGFSYLLALRLFPFMPFNVVNLTAGAVGMRLRVFVWATCLGITPATIVFASVGAGLGDVLAEGGRVDAGFLLRPAVMLPLACVALLSLLPILARRWQNR